MNRLVAKIQTFTRAARRIENWPKAIALRANRGEAKVQFHFRDGMNVICRRGTEDWNVLNELLLADGYARAFEYLHSLPGEPRVLDLGANIGLFSLRAAREHARAQIVACEPAPPTITVLKENLAANPDLNRRIQVLEVGAGSTTRTARFFYSEASPQSAGICYGAGPSFEVPIRSFVEIVASIGEPIALLKMDVEGAEFEIVNHTPPEVWRKIGTIALETHDPIEPDFDANALLARLRAVGFEVEKEKYGPSSYFLSRR